ncbi:hypothetical protein [Paraburkholderia sp. ZP32-5]|uniref:hypothetical protein n=1 Tax=Paraburkholderia sp. ZP32-5 TaxID=2883245 RepID=UPI001F3DEABC|nr:hypothetical protein [Paraburkholderia sp. ZP32-5]
MAFRTYTVLTLLVTSSAAFAWQPLTYPIRSQSPYERGVDTALCYAEASRVSKVNIVREPQIPPRPAPAAKGSSTGAPAKPPLPPSSFSATPLPYAASMPDAASEALAAIAAGPLGASAAKPASGAVTGADGSRGAATAAAGASAASPTMAAGASAPLGASDAASASLQASAASDVKLPPLPAPEPPMTRYWAAYGACMQARGYVVQ